MRFAKLVLLITLAFALVACGKSGQENGEKIPEQYKPEVNSNPKYHMTVEGYVAPQLYKILKPKFLVYYMTTNPECKYIVNNFAGVSSYREKLVSYPIPKAGYFILKIPLDNFQPGFCRWHFLAFNVVITSYSTTLGIYTPNVKVKEMAYRNYQCECKSSTVKSCSCSIKSGVNFSPDLSMSLDNYKFNLSVRRR